MQTLSLDKLQKELPVFVFGELPLLMSTFQINTPLRLAHFLAQCSHESGGFKFINENLNYSAQGLLKVFKKYFTPQQAATYARKPDLIANRVYANRGGNGDEKSGDGWKYRGRGYIQLTLKDNYKAFDQYVPEDIVANPDLVASKYPLLSAGWFFWKNGLNAIADKGATEEVVTQVRRRVNGGTNGLADTIEKFKHYYSLLS